MTPIEAAISALEDAADALEKVPLVLRRTTQPGLWLGTPPAIVTPKLLRDEANHIHDLVGEVRAADATPSDGFVPEWQEEATIVGEAHVCEDCGDTRSPDDHACPNEDCPSHEVDADPWRTTFVTNVFIESPPVDAVAEELRRRRPIRDNPQA